MPMWRLVPPSPAPRLHGRRFGPAPSVPGRPGPAGEKGFNMILKQASPLVCGGPQGPLTRGPAAGTARWLAALSVDLDVLDRLARQHPSGGPALPWGLPPGPHPAAGLLALLGRSMPLPRALCLEVGLLTEWSLQQVLAGLEGTHPPDAARPVPGIAAPQPLPVPWFRHEISRGHTHLDPSRPLANLGRLMVDVEHATLCMQAWRRLSTRSLAPGGLPRALQIGGRVVEGAALLLAAQPVGRPGLATNRFDALASALGQLLVANRLHGACPPGPNPPATGPRPADSDDAAFNAACLAHATRAARLARERVAALALDAESAHSLYAFIDTQRPLPVLMPSAGPWAPLAKGLPPGAGPSASRPATVSNAPSAPAPADAAPR